MLRGLVLVVLTSAMPTIAAAQDSAAPTDFARSPAVAVGSRRLEPLCDGTEIRRMEIQRDVGRGMMYTGIAVALLGAVAVHAHPGRGVPIVLAAGALGLGGVVVAGSAYPDESFWQVTLARAQTGLTTTDDVRSCLHEPNGTSVSGSQEQWTYRARPSAAFRMGHWVSGVEFTFKDGVLTAVKRTEAEADLRAER